MGKTIWSRSIMNKIQYRVIKVNSRGEIITNVVSRDTLIEAETVINNYLKTNPSSIYEIHKVIPLVQIKRKVIPIETEIINLDLDNKEEENKV